jgi:hypothetical protein
LYGYINFPMIEDLWQRLLDQYLRIGLEARWFLSSRTTWSSIPNS